MGTSNVIIKGMHCSSCEVLIERKLKAINGVKHVNVNYTTGHAEIHYEGEAPKWEEVQGAISAAGYTVSNQPNTHPISNPQNIDSPTGVSIKTETREQKEESRIETPKNDYIELASIFVILIGIYFLLKEFNILPQNFGVSDNMSYGVVFILGLIAAMSTCLAVSGGLLLGMQQNIMNNIPISLVT